MSSNIPEPPSASLNGKPSFEQVYAYFCQKGMSGLEAHQFYIVHQTRGWKKRNGTYIKKWKSAAYQWIADACLINRTLYDRRIR